MKLLFAAALGSAALLAGCASSQPEVAAAPADPMSPLFAPGYSRMAASSDLFEIESSRVALQQSRNPQVRQFAQTMIDHHTRTSAEMMQIAQQAGLNPPPPTMLPPQQAAFDRVRAAGPMEFDAVYKREQIAGHQQALSLHQGYAAQGDLPPFRDFASRTVPIIQQHLDMASGLPDYAPPPPPPPPPPARAGERG
jgi:putative membrane protein